MSAKAIYEYDAKELLRKDEELAKYCTVSKGVIVDQNTKDHDWKSMGFMENCRLVVKPDQLIKRRGKLGLIRVNVEMDKVKEFVDEKMNKMINLNGLDSTSLHCGRLNRFLIEPFVQHEQNEEMYICIMTGRENDVILFHNEGGIDIGDVDGKAKRHFIDLKEGICIENMEKDLFNHLKLEEKTYENLVKFIVSLYNVFVRLHFTYMEINPLVVKEEMIYVLDLAAKLDMTADYLCRTKWWPNSLVVPPPFGRDALKEELYVADLDSKSGASLKLTILNEKGRIWTMVAGGGASVIYSDTICDFGYASELANYGEYSGAPTEQQTYDYARTVLSLMTKEVHNEGKILIIGGGIANFTNVAATFKGIVRALTETAEKLNEQKIKIFVRRGGPNYQEGLRNMKSLESSHDLDIHVYGPETHMTAICAMALKGDNDMITTTTRSSRHSTGGDDEGSELNITANFLLANRPVEEPEKMAEINEPACRSPSKSFVGENPPDTIQPDKEHLLFDEQTQCVIWGMQTKAVQSMLDFDYVCSRKTPSVVAMIYPLTGDQKLKFYWGHKEILIPCYKSMKTCFNTHTHASVLVSFASLRSAYESTMDAMQYSQIRSIAIIAEGIPERLTRLLIRTATEKHVALIGPATVGGVKPGCFKIGNTGGMLDNILMSKLYRAGSVAYVSRSGGMSNELNNIISRNSNGVYEGVAIGGDRYPGTNFMYHINRYNRNPDIKMIVLLGEVGGIEEYEVAESLKQKIITKPIVAWCIGTCSDMFTSEVQFGHAGACANSLKETSKAKNSALRDAGAYVPTSFNDLDKVIHEVYESLVEKGTIIVKAENPPPTVPMDYNWARELGLIRKPASFMTSICDERGQELLYAGMPITKVFENDMGIGGVLALLWFQRRLPAYASKFLEMVLMITADHGPAVSGAHNTIVCARAGKDLISSLVSGLLTIGDRFGGALDGAAKQFTYGFDTGMCPIEFVNYMRKEGKLIMGIGHRVKSINNPDMRVTILKKYIQENFQSTDLLDYALEVEKITTKKKPNLILNVDGLIGVATVDLLRGCGCFTRAEADDFIEQGSLNGLFVLGRSLGFIGHFLDQKRLNQGLYRHPWDDISYIVPDLENQKN
ncbi:hypothetical protein SNEBB_004724 [Seison nebaliae]|nr:hypothetical protein SNEBB_004724 [Seison nebaliae]